MIHRGPIEAAFKLPETRIRCPTADHLQRDNPIVAFGFRPDQQSRVIVDHFPSIGGYQSVAYDAEDECSSKQAEILQSEHCDNSFRLIGSQDQSNNLSERYASTLRRSIK
jgi:hypothetical protein